MVDHAHVEQLRGSACKQTSAFAILRINWDRVPKTLPSAHIGPKGMKSDLQRGAAERLLCAAELIRFESRWLAP